MSVFDVKFLSVINFILMKEKRKEYKGVDIDRGCIIRQDFSDRGITSFRWMGRFYGYIWMKIEKVQTFLRLCLFVKSPTEFVLDCFVCLFLVSFLIQIVLLPRKPIWQNPSETKLDINKSEWVQPTKPVCSNK